MESTNPSWFGTTVGRVSGRIKDASFKLKDKEYTLSKNNGENCLHGGHLGLSRVLWDGKVLPAGRSDALLVEFTHTSPHGADGFPGLDLLLSSLGALALVIRVVTHKSS